MVGARSRVGGLAVLSKVLRGSRGVPRASRRGVRARSGAVLARSWRGPGGPGKSRRSPARPGRPGSPGRSRHSPGGPGGPGKSFPGPGRVPAPSWAQAGLGRAQDGVGPSPGLGRTLRTPVEKTKSSESMLMLSERRRRARRLWRDRGSAATCASARGVATLPWDRGRTATRGRARLESDGAATGDGYASGAQNF